MQKSFIVKKYQNGKYQNRIAKISKLTLHRLDEQHFATTKTFGFLVHPNIPLTSPTLKIADIGTGTGIWLLDVAKSLSPTCQFIGFDVSSSAFPPPQTLPPNVSFQVQDMLLPFPASEIGRVEAYLVLGTTHLVAMFEVV